MKRFFETVRAWLRRRVTAMKSEKGKGKREEGRANGGHWRMWIIVRSVRH